VNDPLAFASNIIADMDTGSQHFSPSSRISNVTSITATMQSRPKNGNSMNMGLSKNVENSCIIAMEMEALSRILSYGSFTNAGKTYTSTTLQIPPTP